MVRFVLPLFNRVIIDGHPIFRVVDAGAFLVRIVF